MINVKHLETISMEFPWIHSNGSIPGLYFMEMVPFSYGVRGPWKFHGKILYFPCSYAVVSVDDPGIWSLLKIRNLAHFDTVGYYRRITPDVRGHLKARTRNKKLFPWRPLGVENPYPRKWQDRVKHRDGVPDWQTQYEWLEARYKDLHDRKTVAAQCEKMRIEDLKRKRRLAIIPKHRKKKRL